jgi:hypothetical protein
MGRPQDVSAATWAVAFDSPDQQIKTMAVYNGKLYAGGMLNTQTNGHLYEFDSHSWIDLQLATEIGNPVDLIESMQVYDGSLFIGVRLHIGTDYFARVYRYDGSEFTLDFSAAGSSNYSGIEDLAIHNGQLYAAEGIPNGAVFQRVSESNWASVGGNITNGYLPRSLASFQGALYRGVGVNQVQRWTGTTWELALDTSTQFGITSSSIWSLAASDDTLFAGLVQATYVAYTRIPEFDGTNWSIGTSVTGCTVKLAAIGHQVWAGTWNGKVYWNNGTWHEYGSIGVYAFDFAEYDGAIYAAGSNGTIFRADKPADPVISGRVTDAYGDPVSGVKVTITEGASTTTGADGTFRFKGLAAGDYTLTPTKDSKTFFPESKQVQLTTTDRAGVDFDAFPVPELIDLSIGLHRDTVSPEERAVYQSILEYFADAVFEMSNGAHQIRNVTIYYVDTPAGSTVNIIWTASGWPHSVASGFKFGGAQVNMYDTASFKDCEGISEVNYLANIERAGYTLAHEWGHYYYGLYDEYKASCPSWYDFVVISPHYDDVAVIPSIMSVQSLAVGGNYSWLNFSTLKNIRIAGEKKTAQDRVYGLSGWDTVTSPHDPLQKIALLVEKTRTFYPVLVPVAPQGDRDPSLELSLVSREFAHSKLNPIWEYPSGMMTAEDSATPYTAFINAMDSENVTYPKPLAISAQVNGVDPLTGVGVTATFTAPDLTTGSVLLADDGLAPDSIARDGVYSGLIPYTQNGDYTIDVSFDNDAGEAELTQLSAAHSVGPNGETWVPEFIHVSELFNVSSSLVVSVSGVVDDDHGDVPAAATLLATDNSGVWGRIDRVGDVDVFQVMPDVDGEVSVRLTSLGQGMLPHVEIIAADGTTRLGVVDFVPNPVTYFNVQVPAAAGVPFFVAVSHSELAASGIYMISAGEWLDSDRQVSTMYIPLIR